MREQGAEAALVRRRFPGAVAVGAAVDHRVAHAAKGGAIPVTDSPDDPGDAAHGLPKIGGGPTRAKCAAAVGVRGVRKDPIFPPHRTFERDDPTFGLPLEARCSISRTVVPGPTSDLRFSRSRPLT